MVIVGLMLGDVYIPFTPVLPVAQFALLIVIVVIEARIIRKSTAAAVSPKRLWISVTGANLLTTLIGVALVFPIVRFEEWLGFGWGSQYLTHPILWWLSCVIYGFVLPYSFLIFCYVVSWRTEFALLVRWLAVPREDIPSLRRHTILAHRITYGLLAIPALIGSLWYATILFHRP
jgi:hypothetical protein